MSRPPFSIITNNVPDQFASNSSHTGKFVEPGPGKPKKHVTFEPSGLLVLLLDHLTNRLALLLAEKHERTPSVLKMSQFNETLDLLKSATAWNKFSIKRFGVDFKRTTYRELRTLIKDPKWYDPETETTTKGFVSCTFPLRHY